MLTNIICAFLIGSIVGLAGHVRKRGKIVKPRKTKQYIYLGFLEDVLMAALAAVLLVLAADADSALRVVLLSVTAGFGGDAVLRGIELLKTGAAPPPPNDQVNEESKKKHAQ
ncbi:DUF4257 domain-containing protein [Mesobacillus zeae]|uniref:DUF4257 domain-containing protein n=1 Tax=Mesobacillus zeae TaxID=1917180 RepID=A0A398BL12_9BACI|nr:DUF4257 domain-containing protein [Mesobacillus zeae]RID88096.1 DUF4257 domain-containing protein [Mesobacillus zeae]